MVVALSHCWLKALFLISLHGTNINRNFLPGPRVTPTRLDESTYCNDKNMSGERSDSSSGGPSASVAAGCSLSESSRARPAFGGGGGAGSGSAESGSAQTAGLSSSFMGRGSGAGGGLAVFSWGRGEDGQLGIGDTRYVCFVFFAGRGVGCYQFDLKGFSGKTKFFSFSHK